MGSGQHLLWAQSPPQPAPSPLPPPPPGAAEQVLGPSPSAQGPEDPGGAVSMPRPQGAQPECVCVGGAHMRTDLGVRGLGLGVTGWEQHCEGSSLPCTPWRHRCLAHQPRTSARGRSALCHPLEIPARGDVAESLGPGTELCPRWGGTGPATLWAPGSCPGGWSQCSSLTRLLRTPPCGVQVGPSSACP